MRSTINILNQTIHITSTYKPPQLNVDTFISSLNTYLTEHSKGQFEIFAGDININILEKI